MNKHSQVSLGFFSANHVPDENRLYSSWVNHWFKRIYGTAALVVFVVGCGGGGGGGTTSGAAVGPNISSDVPVAASSQIQSIESSAGSVSPESKVIVAVPASQNNLIIATNKSGDPMLLGIGSTEILLNAQTTAVGLARIGMGPMRSAEAFSPSDVEAAIVNSPNFNQLLSAVSTNLASGESLMRNVEVLRLANMVKKTAQKSLALLPPAAPAKNSATRRLATAINFPAPHFIFNDDANSKIYIDDVNGNAINVFNSTFLSWHAVLKNKAGVELSSTTLQPLAFPEVKAGIFTINNPLRLVGFYLGTADIQVLSGDSSGDYYLTVSQDAKTRFVNDTNLIGKGLFFVLDELLSQLKVDDRAIKVCALEISKSVLNEKLPELVSTLDGATAVSYLKAVLPVLNVNFIWDKFSACTAPGIEVASFVKTFENSKAWVGTAFRLWAALEFAADFAEIYAALGTMQNHRNLDTEWHICKSRGILRPCDIKLDIQGAIDDMAVGATRLFTALATDLGDVAIPLPTQVVWSSSSPSITVDVSGRLTAMAAGSATVTATDGISGKFSSRNITVLASNAPAIRITSASCILNRPTERPSWFWFVNGITSVTQDNGVAGEIVRVGTLVNQEFLLGFGSSGSICDNWTGQTLLNATLPYCSRKIGDPLSTTWRALVNTPPGTMPMQLYAQLLNNATQSIAFAQSAPSTCPSVLNFP